MTNSHIESQTGVHTDTGPNARALDSLIACWVGGAFLALVVGGPMLEAALDHEEDPMACPAVVNTHDMPECK